VDEVMVEETILAASSDFDAPQVPSQRFLGWRRLADGVPTRQHDWICRNTIFFPGSNTTSFSLDRKMRRPLVLGHRLHCAVPTSGSTPVRSSHLKFSSSYAKKCMEIHHEMNAIV